MLHTTDMVDGSGMSKDDIILMGHGGGGVLTGQLIQDLIMSELGNPILATLDDAACLGEQSGDLVMTTDSFVVNPVFFPGGDIGRLAACGTLNDLAMQGGEPRYLTLGLILEEGLLLEDLRRIVASVGQACREVGAQVVAGDTKVVERRGGFGIFVNTAGLGVKAAGVDVASSNAQRGDVVVSTGTLGDHGIAIMNVREGLGIQSDLVSDAAPLWGLVKPLLEALDVHCLRDPTRGGVAAALCDIAKQSGCGIRIQEAALPVRDEVRGACDLLGFDPLNVANEGKALVLCPESQAEAALGILKAHPLGADACVIGKVVADTDATVLLRTRVGGDRIVGIPLGEDLPRIC